MKTGFFSDPIFLEHDTGSHPENSGRLIAITEKFEQEGLLDRLIQIGTRKATEDEIALIHTTDYLRYVEEAVHSGRPYLDTPDCIISPQTFEVAMNAAGSLVNAVTMVSEEKLDNAFVACRPPGHHAEQNQAMGFCYFNNVAIGAAYLTEKLGYQRVLIFDFDVHHGNGTQHSFEERKDIFFASIHQHPSTCYPGTGFADERGRGNGLGFTLNVPVMPESTDEVVLDAFNNQLLPAFREFNPDFILVSAGFDAHADDPLAMVNLTQKGFDEMITGMKELSLECAKGKLVSVLEGGYNYQRLSECVASHVQVLQSDQN